MNTTAISARTYLWVCTAAVMLTAATFLAVNYFIDRYYVFHPQQGIFEEIMEPNTRVLKARFLERHCAEFDAMIMGSSRAAAYTSSAVNRAFAVNAYNFGVASGHLNGILARLEWLETLGCFPRRILLPLSIDRLRMPGGANDLLRKEYPAIVAEDDYRREFLLSYIGTGAFISNLRKLARRWRRGPTAKLRYDMSTGDVRYLWQRKVEIPRCPSAPVLTDPGAIRAYARYLFDIKAIAARHHSEITLVWNPIPAPDQIAHVDDAITLFHEIDGVFDHIYRLPPNDARLRDSKQYHDPGHFVPRLGTAVIKTPEHRVSLKQLLMELEVASADCQ